MKKLELTQLELKSIISAASQMNDDFYENELGMTDKKTAKRRYMAYLSGMEKLRTARNNKS